MGDLAGYCFAHTPGTASSAWHDLRDHLEAVADRAERFGAKFAAANLCRALGLAHDLAKADPRFQAYLAACHEGRSAPKCPHADPSAKAMADALKLLSLAVVGHHTGLPDLSTGKQRLLSANPESVAWAVQFSKGMTFPDQASLDAESATVDRPLDCEFFVRMCFSALVDADFLDTETHFNPAVPRPTPTSGRLASLASQSRQWMSRFEGKSGVVNQVRADVLHACQAASTLPQGAFRLTVPTGGGKTLSGLTFALEHAVYHDLDRLIVAIPYTSIIDQTVDVYEQVFGKGEVLEHHSAIEPGDDGEGVSLAEYRRRLAAENWDVPIIVTTTVQLFESLFANRTSKCRKLHNIARSVVVLDEVQTLPIELLEPTLDVLQELISRYGVSVVFCSATQPDYAEMNVPLLAAATEIVPEPSRNFERLRRVTFTSINDPIEVDTLAQMLQDERQVLCILNSRRDAVSSARALAGCEAVYHLSTLMCPHHRRRVLTEVRMALAANMPCRLVSTQVVEAGVDLDFPIVFRAIGPLDRIIQAAGRCNREGLHSSGECRIFSLADGRQPRGPYATGSGLATTVLKEHLSKLDQPEVIGQYFRDLFRSTSHDSYGIQALRKDLRFEETAKRYKLIAEPTKTIIALQYSESTVADLLRRAVEEPGRGATRRLQPYGVNVPEHEFLKFQSQGLVREHESGLHVYTGPYDALVGIGSGSEHDPADLVG